MGSDSRRNEETSMLLNAVFAELNSSGVDYCLLHFDDNLTDRSGRNVKILVARSQMQSALASLEQTCRRTGWNVSTQTVRMGCRSLLLCSESSPQMRFVLDVVSEITWGWMPVCDATRILATKTMHRGVPLAEPGADAAVRVLETVLHGRLPDENDWINIRISTRSQPALFCEVLGTYIDSYVVRKTLHAIDTADINGLGRVVVRMRRSLLHHAAFCRTASTVRGLFAFMLRAA